MLKVAPWEGWEVKDDLLEKLKEWNEDETQDTAVNIMKKVQRKLDSAAKFAQSEFITNALELIPNDPFPIKTVVTGLVNLMIIGIVRWLFLAVPAWLLNNSTRPYRRLSRRHSHLRWKLSGI